MMPWSAQPNKFIAAITCVGLLSVFGVACEYDAAFEQVRCESSDECGEGATCSEGFCVFQEIDAGPDVLADVDEPAPVVAVEVTPEARELAPGQTFALEATLLDADGRVVTDEPLNWSTSAADIVEVDDQGTVTAVGLGSALITARSGFSSGSALIDVVEQPVASVTISPDPVATERGTSVALAAEVALDDDTLVDDRPVTWSIDDNTIATVDSTGVVFGLAEGTTLVTARAGGVSDSVTVEILPSAVADVSVLPASITLEEGQRFQASAFIRDATGRLLTDRAADWSSEDASIATVDTSGEITAVSAGTTRVIAGADGLEADIAVEVLPVAVDTVELLPSQVTLEVGDEFVLTATARDSGGAELTGRATAWASSDGAVVTVGSTGKLTALAPGSALVSADVEGRAGATAVTVIPPVTDSLSVTPASVTLEVGQTTGLSVSAQDASGDPISNPNPSWSSDDASVAVVSADGQVLALAPGTATITAELDGESATATVDVDPRSVASVTLSPASATLELTQSVDLRAEVRAQDGTLLEGRAVTWTSADDALVTVDAAGTATAQAAGGPVDVTATVEGVSGSTAITAQPRSVASVNVTPARDTLIIGDTLSLQAEALADDGATLSRPITWTTTDPTIASVDASGGVTALQAGLAIIRAQADGIAGFAAILVEPSGPDTVTISPASLDLDVGESAQLDATTFDAQANQLFGLSYNWTSNDPSVASVDASGLVTAQAEGSADILASESTTSTTGASTATVSWRFGGLWAGDLHACALSTNDNMWCWGDNQAAQLGDGTVNDRASATALSSDITFTDLAAGSDHTCALDANDLAWCWGANDEGQLGDGTTVDSRAPVAVSGATTFSALVAGDQFTCGLTQADTIECWGRGDLGQLGDGSGDGSETPTEVDLDYTTWTPTAIAAGLRHACTLADDGATTQVFCWGSDDVGQLGDNNPSDREAPAEVVHDFASIPAAKLTAGAEHTCMIADDAGTRRTYCWGENGDGQLGDGTTDPREQPVEVSIGAAYSAIFAGGAHTCALLGDNSAECWGNNADGQLGDNSSGGIETAPVAVLGSATWTSLSLGDDFTCGLAVDDRVLCWGADDAGQLGNAGAPTSAIPTPIATP